MENKNFIMALVLSVAVMFIWGEFFAPKPEAETTQEQKTDEAQAQKPAPTTLPNAAPPVTLTPQRKVARQHAVEKIELTGKDIRLSVSTQRGAILEAVTVGKRYKKEVNLLDGLSEGAYFPEVSTLFTGEPTYENKGIHDGNLILSYTQEGVTEEKIFTLLDGYRIKITRKLFNNTAKAISYTPSLAFHSQYQNEDIFHATRKMFEIVAGNSNAADTLDSKEEIDEFVATTKEIEFAGIDYGYFLYSVIADGRKIVPSGDINTDNNKTDLIVSYESHTIEPGKNSTDSFVVYLGPKEAHYLKAAAPGLEQSIHFGWMTFLSKPLLVVLNFLYIYIGNYGIAILILTLLIKLLLFPLSNASYKSMNKMKSLQPKIAALKEKYKDDKEALNKETMALYQKEGVNPLGGCLPMFIQMPVYIALYYMISNAGELYGAPFLPFWLTDLSMRDPYYILPVSLGALMFLQQKMTPQQMDNAQAKIMLYTMPLVFTWISLFMPSGLTLYWFVNTVLGLAQQYYITRKYA
ncbi:membrane protein insertase YidC [bacterium]|nr:membrane protein insertase YidC [bacterium]